MTRYFGDWNKIDYLQYKNYNGNLLGRVDDLAGANIPFFFQDKTSGSGYDYTYDANGNLTSDYNKSISSITYNYLNLPNVVTTTGKGIITYTYDAAGNKLQKTILDQTVTPNKTTTYTYAGDYVYRNGGTTDTLEFISHPEGRLRPIRIDTTQAISIANLKYIYDYYIKDYLGSVRDVLTTEQETDIYAATMETANAAKENALFSNISSTATAKPAGFSNDNSNQKVSRLNGSVNISGNYRVGPSIVLKVMTGDTISISTYSWYTGPVQPAATGVTSIVNDLIPLIKAGVGNANGAKGGAIPTSTTTPLLTTDISTLISDDSTTYITTRPKAFLNWMVVGEDYAAATGSPNHVGALQVPICNAGDSLKQIVGPTNMVIRRNGWIYIYLSNESAQDVFFDNLVINLKHGPLVEQKVYYAFGVENPALSTQAIKQNYYPNRIKYNSKELQNKEFTDGTGLEDYDYGARMYDPQLGRWMITDPLSEKSSMWSLYNFAYNNPQRFVDFDGMEPYGSDDGDQMVNYIKVQNTKTGEVTTYITGNADQGAQEFHVDGLNGGAGVHFRSRDEAAFAWALENSQYANTKYNEHGATIYSQQSGINEKSYSYNGSFEGDERHVEYHSDEIPKGAEIEGYIHTHATQPDFSKHETIEDRNQILDEDVMDKRTDKDFYLVNMWGELRVNRGVDGTSSNGNRGESEIMATGLINGQIRIKLANWQGPDGNPLKYKQTPDILKKYRLD